jgi:hypothetical protein
MDGGGNPTGTRRDSNGNLVMYDANLAPVKYGGKKKSKNTKAKSRPRSRSRSRSRSRPRSRK